MRFNLGHDPLPEGPPIQGRDGFLDGVGQGGGKLRVKVVVGGVDGGPLALKGRDHRFGLRRQDHDALARVGARL
ncbi:hypothetical protein, partial [Caulobacter sp. B11]|uniref:hypothetical protein n=1 Tax=Caulobacter sp. B11 TaxID=2048899 RepID=UPI001374744A